MNPETVALRYTLIKACDLPRLLLKEGFTTYESFLLAEQRCVGMHLLVFAGDTLVFTADIGPLWEDWRKRNPHLAGDSPLLWQRAFNCWCLTMERYVRAHLRKGLSSPRAMPPTCPPLLAASACTVGPASPA